MRQNPRLPRSAEFPPHAETMTAYALRTHSVHLQEHIAHARTLYEAIGLSDDSFKVDAEKHIVQVTLQPTESIQGNKGIIHGGALALLIDAASGALGAVLAGHDKMVFTQLHAGIRYIRPVILDAPIIVTAEQVSVEGSEKMIIKTVIKQNGKPVVIAKTEMVPISVEMKNA